MTYRCAPYKLGVTPRYRVTRVIFLLMLLTASSVANADVQLPALFQDHMVLQRDRAIHIRGWSSANEKVVVHFAGRRATATANARGEWSVALEPLAAGGPYELVVQGDNTLILSDILVGDVWVCSGQSNMAWTIAQTDYIPDDTAFLEGDQVRLYTVDMAMDYKPRKHVSGSGWKTLDPETVKAFSAVGYHFGKHLQQALGVPIGLISANLGATSIETWMSYEALMDFPQFHAEVKPVLKADKSFEELYADFARRKSSWYAKPYFKGTGITQGWFNPAADTGGWQPLVVAGNTWQDVPALKDHDGAVWFRKTFDLPDNYQQETFRIQLGQIDDHDITWVNGEKIGETFGRHNHRNYEVPVSKLKRAGNLLVVRVYDAGGLGGFTTSPFWASPLLRGEWMYRKGDAAGGHKVEVPPLPNATPFSSPGVLFNGMIAPLTEFPIKGVIWYQGESNASRAYEYRDLFPAMISDWRKQWDQGSFPFLFVQLANYMAEPAHPGESEWAELREAQAMALQLEATGMATAIDIGEADDIHPTNKKEVGRRLGLSALKVAYDRDIVASGPVFREMRIEGDEALIFFDHTGSGLVTKEKHGYVRGFQIAGADKKFYWATASVSGGHVTVKSPQVKNPVAVRYAWADNPGPLDLYNKEGLPAVPFRTDAWPGTTARRVFGNGPRF